MWTWYFYSAFGSGALARVTHFATLIGASSESVSLLGTTQQGVSVTGQTQKNVDMTGPN